VAEGAPESGDSLPPQLARLPPGRHGLPREFVAANHRDRLVAACAQEIPERGYTDTTVAHIIKAAAVSRRTFYEYFDSKEACFLATYELIVAHIRRRVEAAVSAESEWPQRVRAGIAALLEFVSEEPRLARFCMVEPLAAGPPITERYREALESFTPIFAGGRDPSTPDVPPADTEAAVAAGVLMLVTRRLIAGDIERLEDLLPDLLETALTPFLGAAEAERISRQANN
jgi:AcrR family transcriptional regulator